MCSDKRGHKFQKFDDTSLFCERCAERRVVKTPTWVPDWTYRPYPYWTTPYQPTWQPYIVWSTSVTASTSSDFTVWNDTGGGGSIQTNAIAGPQTQTPRGVKRT